MPPVHGGDVSENRQHVAVSEHELVDALHGCPREGLDDDEKEVHIGMLLAAAW